MKGTEWLEALVAGAVCVTIVVAVIAFIAMMQPIQNVVTTEATELKLIRAIYVDEFARKFVKYGMKFLLEEAASKAALTGGISFTGSCTTRCWVNATNSSNLLITGTLGNDTYELFPYDHSNKPEERIMYFQWCTNTTDYDTYPNCNSKKITDLLIDEDTHKDVIAKSFENSFSMSSYLSKFARYAVIQPEITFENYTISVDPLSAEGYAHVIARAAESGVNSLEKIKADVNFPLWDMVKEARGFVDGTYLTDTAASADFCNPDYTEVNFTQDMNNAINSVTIGSNNYDFRTETISLEPACNGSKCVRVISLHTMNNTNKVFRFKTEFRYCRSS